MAPALARQELGSSQVLEWRSTDGETQRGALVRIDPTTGETERIDVGGLPAGVAVGAGLVWVSVG